VAETSGKIIEIGRVMLFKACQAAAAYPDPVVVSVNLSAVQLIKLDVPALVLEVLAATGLPPERLKLEITESVFINDMRNVKQLIDTLKKMGVTLSLDDFGTGYSSLSYLRTLGFDELKIDRSFVSEIGTNKRSLAVTHTIIQLARTLDMKTVAEGIETEEQARLLTATTWHCCLQMPGFTAYWPASCPMLPQRMADTSETPPHKTKTSWLPAGPRGSRFAGGN
jgi:EAL domain-containing protein (putative c-di-GMP-specific phosphodiesterase class I)